MNPITTFQVSVCIPAGFAIGQRVNRSLAFFGAAVVIAFSRKILKMSNVWQKFVIIRMGKLQSVERPGLFVIIEQLQLCRATRPLAQHNSCHC
ncbi:MAG: hypothetical protein Q7T38_04740 [Gallionella sp.]|nr:hypothetical protein [Gallionella sp.]